MPIETSEQYVASLRGRGLEVYLNGERVEEPVDHPVVAPSVRAVAESYRLAQQDPELATAWSSLSEQRVNRFLHVAESAADVVGQNRMQRRLGQLTGTCFQRCVGMDAINALYSVTKHGVVALTENLNVDLQNENAQIGCSVLCPGFVNTNIFDSGRNRPANLANETEAPAPTPDEAINRFVAAKGITGDKRISGSFASLAGAPEEVVSPFESCDWRSPSSPATSAKRAARCSRRTRRRKERRRALVLQHHPLAG